MLNPSLFALFWASLALLARSGASLSAQVTPFKAHKIEAPSNMVETSMSELVRTYKLMYTIRRMEIAADMMYKAKLIRGFCHL